MNFISSSFCCGSTVQLCHEQESDPSKKLKDAVGVGTAEKCSC